MALEPVALEVTTPLDHFPVRRIPNVVWEASVAGTITVETAGWNGGPPYCPSG